MGGGAGDGTGKAGAAGGGATIEAGGAAGASVGTGAVPASAGFERQSGRRNRVAAPTIVERISGNSSAFQYVLSSPIAERTYRLAVAVLARPQISCSGADLRRYAVAALRALRSLTITSSSTLIRHTRSCIASASVGAPA